MFERGVQLGERIYTHVVGLGLQVTAMKKGKSGRNGGHGLQEDSEGVKAVTESKQVRDGHRKG